MVFLTFPDLFIQLLQPSLTLSWRDVAKLMSDEPPQKGHWDLQTHWYKCSFCGERALELYVWRRQKAMGAVIAVYCWQRPILWSNQLLWWCFMKVAHLFVYCLWGVFISAVNGFYKVIIKTGGFDWSPKEGMEGQERMWCQWSGRGWCLRHTMSPRGALSCWSELMETLRTSLFFLFFFFKNTFPQKVSRKTDITFTRCRFHKGHETLSTQSVSHWFAP